MQKPKLIYRLVFLVLTIFIIPALPILIIFIGTSSPEYVIRGTLNMSLTHDVSAWDLYRQAVINLLSFNLGVSTSSGMPVSAEICSGLYESFKTIIPAIIVSYIAGTIIGFYTKEKQSAKNSKYDFIFYIPIIVFSYLFLFLAAKAGIDFTSGIRYVFAIIILSVFPTFVVAKAFTSNYNNLIKNNYYNFHKSLGFANWYIFKKFMIRKFTIEYLSFFENLVIYMFGFIYFVEAPFAINGLGSKFVLGIQRFDYPLIIGFCIVGIIIFSIINIFVDFIKLRIDPRIINK
ncbi:MAG: ABC transporter permease subunit [Bacteroidia bacterium]|nr:ABC transporter permease subunit [Bacteroidia bacterium]